MPPSLRMPCLLTLAASAAAVVSGLLVPSTALAATTAAPHALLADDRVVAPGDPGAVDRGSSLLLVSRDRFGGGDHGKVGSDTGILIDPPKRHTWVCVAAPCEPPT
ncbi:hypothetical protein [Streptomyces sp. NBC_01244]|uniref:hypothetical protein n=1 Tax=Streptomyces sp. NBC_01244 TaxID=2903797 RepID=UPI002E0DD6AB|nr:hypothetical protein OG247_00715 [Streptomyces sp. NBC_01244]